jgi:hypothetical protein
VGAGGGTGSSGAITDQHQSQGSGGVMAWDVSHDRNAPRCGSSRRGHCEGEGRSQKGVEGRGGWPGGRCASPWRWRSAHPYPGFGKNAGGRRSTLGLGCGAQSETAERWATALPERLTCRRGIWASVSGRRARYHHTRWLNDPWRPHRTDARTKRHRSLRPLRNTPPDPKVPRQLWTTTLYPRSAKSRPNR